MEKKIDYKKKLKEFYAPSPKAPVIVPVPAFHFLMIDGEGSTDSAPFADAIGSLFTVSYKSKFMIKKQTLTDYAVMPLEGLWWADDMNDFVTYNKSKWKWTLMIMQPEFVSGDTIGEAIDAAKKKENTQALEHLRFSSFAEGTCAQIMHIGPFSDEHPNIMKLHRLIEEQGGSFAGKSQKHHEIYLNDFRKVDPSKMKTILRQPFSLK